MAFRIGRGGVEIVALRDGDHTPDWIWHFPKDGGDCEGCLNFGAFLVIADGKTVLVDTGWGPHHEPPGGLTAPAGLLADMASAGVGPDDVDLVVFTHLHPDHVGWNLILDPPVRPRFPRARYLVPREDWLHYNVRDDIHPGIVEQALPLERLGVLQLIDDGHRVTSSIRAIAAPGHTPGHTVYAAGDDTLLLGDLAHHPDVLERTRWHQRFDWNPEEAVATREKLLDQAEREGTLVGLGHFPPPSLGHVIRKDGRRIWHPLETR
ncbi:MBL fold metallo-hydrolase [Sinosporangium siamense]|uniref:Metallo-beta-lactamase domain-containing protein n=1 Tax=Sinosporangium siamense TaxID=1367973 RepID=A0A919RAR3_9ACTN|nr:MBL fold metallo-hydrolase [Sinosporangium siamense]GII90505.1 hypothetical protein Ssi02_07360 [Sinosporangium siamense]